MNDYREKYNDLVARLSETRRRETLVLLTTGIFRVSALIILAVLITSAFEAVAYGDIAFRSVLAFLLFGGAIISFALFIYPSLLRFFGIKNKPALEHIALRIGSFYPELKDRICNVLQLVQKVESTNVARPDNTSKTLSLAAFENTTELALTKDFNIIIEKKEFRKSAFYFALTTGIAIILFIFFQSSLGASFNRIINFTKSYVPPAPFTLTIEPKYKSLLRGSSAEIKVLAEGKSPDRIKLYIKEEQQKEYDEYIVRSDSISHDGAGYFSFELPSLRKSICFYAESDWLNSTVKTDVGTIRIIERPFIRSLNGNIIFLGYTRLASKKIDEQNANVSALKGSRVELNIFANKELKYAEIIVEKTEDRRQKTEESKEQANDSIVLKIDTIKYAMKVSGRKAFGSFRVSNSGSYHIKIYDIEGKDNNEPIKYSLVALNDDYPSINLIEPLVDVQVTEQALLPIRTSVSDDYGFSQLKLNYRQVQSRYTQPWKEFKSLKIPILSNETSAEVSYIWDLNKIGISPDDVYEYYLEVFDNDAVQGPKSARTQTLMLKLPSLEEVLSQTDKQQDKVEKDISEVLKKAENVRKDIQELNKELLKKQDNKPIEWKDKKKAEDIVKRQEELKQKLSDIQKNLENITENLKQKDAISEETFQKYMELQKLMNEMNSSELKSMQEQIQKMMNQATPEQIQEAMKKVKFDEEKFRKSIERTMNMLKRLKAEQKADAIKKQAEEMADKQEDLAKQTDNNNPNDKEKKEELSDKQDKLKEDFKKMIDELKELEKLMKELEDMPMDELEDSKNSLNQEETNNELNNAKESAKSGDFKKAKNSQKKVASNLEKFAKDMQKLKDKMQDKNMKEAIRKMQKAISDMLKLSEKQEKTKERTKATDYNSTKFQELLSEQAMLNQQLGNTVNGLMELSQKSFAVTPQMVKQLGDALKSMGESLKELAERNPGDAMQEQTKAMSSMNQAVMNMQSMLNRMQKSGSCSNPNGSGDGQGEGESGNSLSPSMSSQSFMEQLQQIANQQQGLNSIMQKMGNKGPLTQEEQAQMSKMMTGQKQLQKSVEELAEEQRKAAQNQGKKLGLGNLDKIAEDMKETISELEQGRIQPNTLKRQDRILSRLLDASRSIHERDKEEKREAETGIDKKGKNPMQFDMSTQEGKSRAMQEMLKSIQQGYTKDYEELIRKYFEVLQSRDSEKEQ